MPKRTISLLKRWYILRDARLLVILTVATALVFDFTNGFHDTQTRWRPRSPPGAASPGSRSALAAVLNLIGAFLSVAVAATIASGIVDQTTITVPIIFAGLVGAIIWNVITWYMGIPSSRPTHWWVA